MTAIFMQTSKRSYPFELGTTSLIANCMINLYTTTFITTQLLRHRSLARFLVTFPQSDASRSIPTSATARQDRIIKIFIESAAINVPIVIATAVGGLGKHPWYYLMFSITAYSQVGQPPAKHK